MGAYRHALSRMVNVLFSRGLDVPIQDLSSGFRLYRTGMLRELPISSRDYDVLQQILVQAFAEGWRVREIPFVYEPHQRGSSNKRVLRVGLACLRTFGQMWMLRNSILAADYDDRYAPYAYAGSPDFKVLSFRTTNVMRWEYKPGSTLFVVWQQGREGLGSPNGLHYGHDFGDVFSTPSSNAFLVKLAYWLNP